MFCLEAWAWASLIVAAYWNDCCIVKLAPSIANSASSTFYGDLSPPLGHSKYLLSESPLPRLGNIRSCHRPNSLSLLLNGPWNFGNWTTNTSEKRRQMCKGQETHQWNRPLPPKKYIAKHHRVSDPRSISCLLRSQPLTYGTVTMV